VAHTISEGAPLFAFVAKGGEGVLSCFGGGGAECGVGFRTEAVSDVVLSSHPLPRTPVACAPGRQRMGHPLVLPSGYTLAGKVGHPPDKSEHGAYTLQLHILEKYGPDAFKSKDFYNVVIGHVTAGSQGKD